MTEDRSGLLVGKLLTGDRAEGQIRFIQANGHLFREVAREHPESDPLIVTDLIIDMFKLTDLHRRTLQKLRGIVKSEQRVIEEEDVRLSLTNRGMLPAPKQQGKKGQSKTPAPADEQPAIDLQPAPQTPSASQAPVEQPTEPVIHTPPAGPNIARPKLRSMVNQLNLPHEITSLLHSYLYDKSDEELRAAALKIPMPWQGYTVPDDVQAVLKYVDALG